VAYNNSWSKQEGLLASLSGLDTPGTNYTKGTKFPNWVLSGDMNWVLSPKFVVGVRGGYRKQDTNDFNVPNEPLFRFPTTNNVNYLDTPASLQHGTGFTSILSNTAVSFDTLTRTYFHADGTSYFHAGGEHQVKFGMQYDRVGEDIQSGELRPRVTLNFDSVNPGYGRGTYGYYSVRSQTADPNAGFITQGNVHTNNVGLFIQDSWTVNNKLTINGGLRTEREEVPAYAGGNDDTGAAIPPYIINFSFADKLAPRVGAAYDLKGDGKWKVFASWGIFYDIFKLELPQGSFGGQKWVEYYYTLDTPDWTSLVPSGCPPACPGTFQTSTDFRVPSFGADVLEPNLKPMKSMEFTTGIDHELNATMAVSVHYVHKQLDRAVEDTGFLTPDGNEGYVIANPSEGLTALAYTNPDIPMPKPKRQYDSVEFAVDKRFANNWSLRAAYLWSRLYGNYSGLSQSDENGRADPNVGRGYDYPAMMFTGQGEASYGPLATDRPNQFKAQAIYQFNFGTAIGANEYVASGLPVTREIGILPTSNYPLQYLGRGSDGRTDMFSQTDIFLQHGFKMGGGRRLELNFTLFNLFNEEAGVSKYSTYQKTNGVNIDVPNPCAAGKGHCLGTFYDGGVNIDSLIVSQAVAQDPRFLQYNAFQLPISARFGVKFIF